MRTKLAIWVCACTLVLVCAGQAVGGQAGAGSSRAPTLQEQIDALDRDARNMEDLISKATSGSHLLILGVCPDSKSTLVGPAAYRETIRLVLDGRKRGWFPIAVSVQDLTDHLTTRLAFGEMTGAEVVAYARAARTVSLALTQVLRDDIRAAKERRTVLLRTRDEAARRAQAPPRQQTNRPTGGGARGASGQWRLKDGYPKFKPKEQCATLNQSNTRTSLDTGPSSITVSYADLHGSTKQVTHSFDIEVSFGELGKPSYEAGELTTFEFAAQWSWNKDGGGYTAAYPLLGYTGGVTVQSAEPRQGNRSVADSTALSVGRSSSGTFKESDTRTITLKIPPPGTEFTLSVGVGGYGGAGLVTWAYEWVAR